MTSVAHTVQGRHRAGLVSRLIADAIDLVLAAGAGLVALAFLAGFRYVTLGPPITLPRWPSWLLSSAASLLVVAYLAAGWLTTGRTAGKHIAGLRVVSRAGRPLRPGQAILRATLCVAFPIGLVWVLVSRRNLSLHDLVVRTAVVYDWSYAPAAAEDRRDSPAVGEEVRPVRSDR